MTVSGKLYVCATPIGNLEDITIRALKALRDADLIAAEDTRRTIKLLNRYRIKTPLTSYHEHNEISKGKELLRSLKDGRRIALVSDAGMPGFSDPGHWLIKACIETDIPVEILPGPSAAISALVISGLPVDAFAYEGYLPRKKGERQKTLQRLADEKRTTILYESPHRVISSLSDILEILGNRPAVLVRELTKKYEEVKRGDIEGILEYVKRQKPRGEIVLVIGGKAGEKAQIGESKVKAEVLRLMKKGFSKKEAIKEVARTSSLPKRCVYEGAKNIKVEFSC